MELEPEGLRQQFEIAQADLDLSGLHFREIAAIKTEAFGHFKLRPALLEAKLADARAKTHADVAGHPLMIVCRLSPTNRL